MERLLFTFLYTNYAPHTYTNTLHPLVHSMDEPTSFMAKSSYTTYTYIWVYTCKDIYTYIHMYTYNTTLYLSWAGHCLTMHAFTDEHGYGSVFITRLFYLHNNWNSVVSEFKVKHEGISRTSFCFSFFLFSFLLHLPSTSMSTSSSTALHLFYFTSLGDGISSTYIPHYLKVEK